jgi:lactate permease
LVPAAWEGNPGIRTMSFLLAVSPVIVIFLLMTWGRRPADVAGVVGWVWTALVATLWFKTSWTVVLLATAAGIVASFPISLMVVTSIFQINVMEEAGAIRRLVVFMKTLASHNRPVQVMLINVGVGTLLAALGATPVSILPPIMLSLGYGAFVAIALPAIGYDALCTYALLGVPVVVFADVAKAVTGREFAPADVGMYFAQYMPVVTTLIALAMLWLVGGFREVRRGWPVALATGLSAGFIAIAMNLARLPTLTGVVAGAGVVLAMLLWLRVRGEAVIDRSRLGPEDLAHEVRMPLALAVLPWILLVAFSVATNFGPLGLYDVLFGRLAMPVEIVPGRPERLRVLWQAYTWVLVATLAAIPLYRMGRAEVVKALQKTARRAPRPALAAAVFFAVAYVLNHSGKAPAEGGAWIPSPDGGLNMVKMVADGCAAALGQAYVGVASYLGLLGGFISGSEASSIVMLTRLHVDTVGLVFAALEADRRLAIALLVAAASAIGGGLASVISPAKLQNAAAVIDQIGMEGKVIRSTAVVAAVMVAAVAALTVLFAALIRAGASG